MSTLLVSDAPLQAAQVPDRTVCHAQASHDWVQASALRGSCLLQGGRPSMPHGRSCAPRVRRRGQCLPKVPVATGQGRVNLTMSPRCLTVLKQSPRLMLGRRPGGAMRSFWPWRMSWDPSWWGLSSSPHTAARSASRRWQGAFGRASCRGPAYAVRAVRATRTALSGIDRAYCRGCWPTTRTMTSASATFAVWCGPYW